MPNVCPSCRQEIPLAAAYQTMLEALRDELNRVKPGNVEAFTGYSSALDPFVGALAWNASAPRSPGSEVGVWFPTLDRAVIDRQDGEGYRIVQLER